MDRQVPSPPLRWAALLGFALGGFLDGIVLHQLLQWHHLLSLWAEAEELTWHVLWDGIFHVLMYVLAALGLWELWRRGLPDGRRFAGALLAGVGLWNVVDGVVFHWALEVHHIRLDAANPVLWDLAWLAAFGLGPLAAGCALIRASERRPDPRG